MDQQNHRDSAMIEFPRLVLRVGFAGKAEILPKVDEKTKQTPTQEELEARIRDRLAEIFTCMGSKLAGIAPGTPLDAGKEPRVARYFSDENPLLRVVTGLCEGSDRLAAEAQLQTNVTCPIKKGDSEHHHHCLDTSLAAVIPFDFATYKKSRPESYRPLFAQDAARCEYILELDGIYEKPSPDTSLAERRRSRGYRAQAQFLLRQCDILVAVVDPKDPGKPGGTMETLRSASEFDLPIVFVNLHTQEVTLQEPGERLHVLLEGESHGTKEWEQGIQRWVTQIVVDPDRELFKSDNHSPGEEKKKESKLSLFLKTIQRWFTQAAASPKKKEPKPDPFLETMFYGKELDTEIVNIRKRFWDHFWKLIREGTHKTAIGSHDEIEKKVDRKFSNGSPFYAWRNRTRYLNYHFSDLYRGAYYMNFLFAVLAVAFAAGSLALMGTGTEVGHTGVGKHIEQIAHSGGETNEGAKTHLEQGSQPPWITNLISILAALKLGIVIFLAWNTHLANSRGWNDLAINTRFLAERMRALFVLPRVGSFRPPSIRPTQYTSRVLKQSSADWLFDTIARSISPRDFPEAQERTIAYEDTVSGEASNSQVPFLTPAPVAATETLRDQWIGEQIIYHDKTAREMGQLHHWTELLVKRLSYAVIAFVSIDVLFILAHLTHLIGNDVYHSFHKWVPGLVFFAAVLPAAVAALNGMRFQSECQRLAERSAVMRALLIGRNIRKEKGGLWSRADALSSKITKKKSASQTDPGSWAEESLFLTEEVTRDFVEEAAEWSVLYDKEVPEQ